MAALENIITIGDTSYLGSPRITFRNGQIKSVNGVFSLSISGDELTIDTVTAIVQHGGPSLPNKPNPREVYISPGDELYVSPSDEVYYYQNPFIPGVHPPVEDLEGLFPYGAPFKWTCDGRVRANFFVKSITRIAKTQYRIEAFSGIGLLDRRNHVGDIYTGQTKVTKKKRFGVKIDEKCKILIKIFAQVESFYYFCTNFEKLCPYWVRLSLE